MNTSWADLNKDGRRLERIIKICEKNIDAELKKPTPEDNRVWGYMDRLTKCTSTKIETVDRVTGVKDLIKKGKKVYAK